MNFTGIFLRGILFLSISAVKIDPAIYLLFFIK